MSERVEWRTVYREGKRVLFVDGRGVGDLYPAQPSEGVLRVRWWQDNKVDRGEFEALVLSEDQAEAVLLEWLERARRDGDG
jgi:hypothetical protein